VNEPQLLSLVLDEHHRYLADGARLAAFERALKEVVRPGDVVVDLGAGTGILGLLACRAGAGRVYALESTSLIGVAREIARANQFGERITFLKQYSRWADLPEKADVVVADQIGRFGFEAGVFEYFADARKRLLKPEGVTVPGRIDLIAAPVETEEVWSRIEFWETTPLGFDVGPGLMIARNTGYPVQYEPAELLGEPAVLASLDPGVVGATIIQAQANVVIDRQGVLHGVGGWFAAQLSPATAMSNSPLAPDRINRHNVFFPVERPVPVVSGDHVHIKMQIVTAETMVRWDVAVRDAGGKVKASSRHSTFEGMLMCKEDLARTRPDFVPKLTPRGQARLTVLSLCDGGRPLAEVEDEVYRRHPDVFQTPREVGVFVAEVVTRYTT
jgi:Ribosomal protein L11 methyltransferase (PrmA)